MGCQGALLGRAINSLRRVRWAWEAFGSYGNTMGSIGDIAVCGQESDGGYGIPQWQGGL